LPLVLNPYLSTKNLSNVKSHFGSYSLDGSMKFFIPLVCLTLCLISECPAHAWGRHDLITQITLDSSEFTLLKKIPVEPEPIEVAAPDLIKRVIPELEEWAELYHRDHDTRYAWKKPEIPQESAQIKTSGREILLWALEDNMQAPLDIGPEKTAADILIHYVDEPDGAIDTGLNRSPYIERVSESMSYFQASDPQTHAFRHYYVPSSWLPPIVSPKGIAPYRAALYAKLSEGAFHTGHPYWGYRFLAWSMHYLQDVTQPWHTTFLPNLSFLRLSKEKMKHEISALHYLTEAFADAWMERMQHGQMAISNEKILTHSGSDPWFVAELSETLARDAHAKVSEIANLARTFFAPIVSQLNPALKPDSPLIKVGGIQFISAKLDFSGNGSGATEFLSPMWHVDFSLKKTRDRLLEKLVTQVNSAIQGSRILISHVLENVHSDQLMKPHLTVIEGDSVSFPS
jgi:hypothetical protein